MVQAEEEVVAANEVVAEEEEGKIIHEEDFFNKFGLYSTSLFPIKFENTLNYFFNYKYKLE